MADEPYNPLDKRHLGESVTAALLKRPVTPLPPPASFPGAGIYALYFHGDLPAWYANITAKNRNDQWMAPIYVGKAVPAGARKGTYGLEATPGEVLYRRLREHAESISQTENLLLEDFKCRYLVVDDIWIPLGESLLIARFSPLWNRVVEGFGNHDPGQGRYHQQRSLWDVIHPGRPWAARLKPNARSPEAILPDIAEFLK
jgi:hypothetical protein